jgi:hypothetical protein
VKRLSLSLLALLLACPATAATKITGETTAKVGGLVNLQAETDVAGAALIWDVFSGVSEVTETYENASERRLIFAGVAGTYTVKVRAISFKGDKTTVETARATVTIGDAPPGPGPGPGPGPNPPAPDDPLLKAFQAAYAQDVPSKDAVSAIAAVFRTAPNAVDAQGAPRIGGDIKTTADLFNWLKAGLAATVPPKSVPKLEAAIIAELNSAFGQPSATKQLDVAATKSELARIGAAVGGLKP